METLADYDNELKNQQADRMEWDISANSQWRDGETDKLRTYVCKSCGGEIVGDENTAATACPYCDNPVVFTWSLCGIYIVCM